MFAPGISSGERSGRWNGQGTPITVAEWAATEFDVRFLVERIMVAGQPLILAGPKKALKTSLLLDLAPSLAMDGFFLGKFNVPTAATVGVMTGESGMATIAETVKRICQQAGYDPAGITNLLITDRVPQFANPECIGSA